MKIVTEVDIAPAMIENLFVSAFEGGSTYWARQVDPVKIPAYPDDGVVWWGHAEIYVSDFSFKVRYDHPEQDESEGKGKKIITQDDVKRALQTMATKYPDHFANILNDTTDADTGDVLLQCCVFDEIIYG